MALNLITAPEPVAPEDLDDYVAQNNLTEALNLMMEQPLRVISGNIPESAVLQIGGAIYRADSDTAITGGASDYVKITPAGATASAAYVADLSGVTWNKTYNGYYDVSGNLYIFNEAKALIDGEIATVQTRYLETDEDGKAWIGNGLHFASDASILWDESQDLFKLNKGLTQYRGNDLSTPDVNIITSTFGAIFTALSPFVPTVGDSRMCSGIFDLAAGGTQSVVSMIRRRSSTEIDFLHREIAELAPNDMTDTTITAASGTTVTIFRIYIL